ncbi:MAG: choice-of-anchor D domain-containing protein [Kofleriaceae bacterium]
MRANNRLLAVGVVGAAVIVACVGHLTLSESEQRAMSYPTSASAGSVMVGQSGTTPAIVFSPATELDNDTIMSVTENCGNWALNLKPLPADVYCDAISAEVGGSGYGSGSCVPYTYSFTATFTPTGPGSSSCPVTVTYTSNTGGGSGSGSGSGSGTIQTLLITLNGTGVAPAYALSMSPPNNSTLQFTDIPINSASTPQKITITNTGTSSITAMGTHSNMAAFPLTALAGASFTSQTLAMGQSASYEVSCAPTAAQQYTGTITFRTSQAQGNITRTVNLNCNGITSDLVIDPNPASFPRSTLVGQPQDLAIQITNNGASTAFTDVHLMSGGEVTITQQPTSPLANGAQTTIVLHYTAETERELGRIDNLVITHTPGGTRTVAINAEALVGEIGVTPALVDFGPVCPGSEKTADLMVYATASGPVNLTSITQPGAPFSISGTGGLLEPNHGNIISLTARVTAQAAGELGDSFTLNTNLPGAAAMHEVQLQGVALPAGVTPTPNLVHFGPGRIGSPTTAKKITISNCGSSALQITGARIEGPSASEFTIVGPEDPLQSIPTMGELEFLVVMNPVTTGTKLAKLVVEYEGGVAETDLDGNGFGIDTDEGGEKTTYYTCSAGGAGGLPIALALLVMRRRRRR